MHNAVPAVGTALFLVQLSMCFSTKSPTMRSSCSTAFSAPFITLRVVRRSCRWFWVAAITPTAPQCRPGRHAQQHTGRSLICLLFHCKHSFPCPLCGPLAVVFPVKNPLYAFFVQKVVVYCSMVFQAVLPFGGILPALDPYKVRRFLI